MTPVRILIVLLFVVLLPACSQHYSAPVADRSVKNTGFHRVARGETVYSIAWAYGMDYKMLARWNGIQRHYRIYPGQVLRLKPPVAKQTRRPASTSKPPRPSSTVSRPSSAKKAVKKTNSSKPVYKQKNAQSSGAAIRFWRWPTRGRLVRSFSPSDSGKKGIAIAGRAGQQVVASAAGKVVYSGEGLLRYGKLIIIKHNNTYLSAYAHNRRLLVREGHQVRQGQKIAEMGRSGTDRVILHFEIRKNGKPVNPLYYLSKK